MAWLLRRQAEGWGIVHFDMTPSCGDLDPPQDYWKEHGLFPGPLTFQAVEIEDRFWPRSARIKSPRTAIPHVPAFCSFFGASQALRDCVESLEPGVHDFRKVEVSLKDGSPLGETYYAMNVRQIVLDAVVWEQTTARATRISTEMKVMSPQWGSVAMARARIAGLHLWTAADIVNGTMAVSNELYGLLKANKLLCGLDAFQVVEV